MSEAVVWLIWWPNWTVWIHSRKLWSNALQWAYCNITFLDFYFWHINCKVRRGLPWQGVDYPSNPGGPLAWRTHGRTKKDENYGVKYWIGFVLRLWQSKPWLTWVFAVALQNTSALLTAYSSQQCWPQHNPQVWKCWTQEVARPLSGPSSSW